VAASPVTRHHCRTGDRQARRLDPDRKDGGQMEKTLSAEEAGRCFDAVLRDVERGDRVVVNENGAAVAAVVPIALYERWKQDRQALFDEMREISARVNLPEEEAEQLIAEAIAAVRAEAARGR
jgi:prevent-host-death family protein